MLTLFTLGVKKDIILRYLNVYDNISKYVRRLCMATEQHRIPMRESIRLMPQPLGYYVRGRREDKAFLLDLIASRLTNFSGIVFEPHRVKPDRELRELVLKQNLDAILDPKTQQLATPGGFSPTLGSLPWGG